MEPYTKRELEMMEEHKQEIARLKIYEEFARDSYDNLRDDYEKLNWKYRCACGTAVSSIVISYIFLALILF